VRVDRAVYTGSVIPPYYDSLIAKLVTHGHDRFEAIQRMKRSLGMMIVEGVSTSIPVHQKIMQDPDFQSGHFDTHFLSRFTRNGRGGDL
jgi:acetyl-CoA carboxylase biotin carboxylase subunit